jgi:uncharacterized membrane protein YhaH (DUF805 family)
MLRKLNEFTKFQGCMGRADYWFYMFVSLVIVAMGIIAMFAMFAMSAVLNPQMEMDPLTIFMLAVKALFGIAALIVYFCAIVRRLHDLNLTGYLALLFFLAGMSMPLLLFMIVILGIVPARHENNRFIKADSNAA